MTKRIDFNPVSMYAPRPAWRHPVLTARHIRDGWRAWRAARRTRHRTARPVGPYGWTAKRIPIVGLDDDKGHDCLALFHPRSPNYPFVQYPNNDRGRRSFLWAIGNYASDRDLSNFK